MPDPITRDYELYDEAYKQMATAKNSAEARDLFVKMAIAVARDEGFWEGYNGRGALEETGPR